MAQSLEEQIAATRLRNKLASLTPNEVAQIGRTTARLMGQEAVAYRRLLLVSQGQSTTGLPRQEPLAPRGKTESSGGIRIPLRSQQAFAKGTTRRRK